MDLLFRKVFTKNRGYGKRLEIAISRHFILPYNRKLVNYSPKTGAFRGDNKKDCKVY